VKEGKPQISLVIFQKMGVLHPFFLPNKPVGEGGGKFRRVAVE
jgi:hypothetical protein